MVYFVLAALTPMTLVSGHCISIPAGYELLGTHPFTLSVSAGTRTLYGVRASDGTLQKLIILQNETIDAGNATRYVYPLKPSYELAGLTFKATTFALSPVIEQHDSRNDEAAATEAFLRTHGLRQPDVWVVRRYAWHDDAGTLERIVFYMEAAGPDTTLQFFGPSDIPAWTQAFEQVDADARDALHASSCA